MTENSISYKDSGVDLGAAEKAIDAYKTIIDEENSGSHPGVVSKIGGFSALFSMSKAGFSPNALLVSATDGVGTKLELANMMGIHDTIGQDLVAMCVNDIAILGAKPLFFLDYLATGKLDVDQVSSIVRGIAKGCDIAGCALVGGETAEMPGFYAPGAYDVAGFCVGGVEPQHLIESSKIKGDEVLIGFQSSGFHSNGFSLIRHILEEKTIHLDERMRSEDALTIGEHLLTPTLIYVSLVQHLLEEVCIRGLSHITGGGFEENIPRMLPANIGAEIDTSTWTPPEICTFICDAGNVETQERYRAFNMGIGMVGAFDQKDVSKTISLSKSFGIQATEIGKLTSSAGCRLL